MISLKPDVLCSKRTKELHTQTHMNTHTTTHTQISDLGCCIELHIGTFLRYHTLSHFFKYGKCPQDDINFVFPRIFTLNSQQLLKRKTWLSMNCYFSQTWLYGYNEFTFITNKILFNFWSQIKTYNVNVHFYNESRL